MLCEFEVTNFKGFGGPEKIPIRPITLLYGPNSSGKSSLLHLLLLIKQTLEESENPETLLLPKGRLVDLGGYLEFLHRHDPQRSFGFRIMLDATSLDRERPRSRSFRWSFLKYLEHPVFGLGIAFKYEPDLATANLKSLDLFAGLSTIPAVTFKQDNVRPGRLFPRLTTQSGRQFSSRSVAERVLRTSTANFEHPLWHALWQRRKLHITNTTTRYEIKRRIDQLQRRMERYEAEGETDSQTEVPKGVLNRRARLRKQTEREMKSLETQLERIDNYTFEQAITDFSRANDRSILTCRNFLPVEVRSEIEESEDESFEFLPLRASEALDPSAVTVMVSSMFREFVESIVYLGPLRENPERHYIFSGNPTEQVGKTGKMVPDILFKNRELVKRLNEKLEVFGVGYTIEVSSVSADTLALHDAYALSLTDKLTGVTTSILDVGFGISQVLPVIVQSLLASGKTLCIEQPEIHLHPRLQSELGSLFAETIKPPYNNSFIVETHSEHIMLRIQKLIRQRVIKPQDVSVVYVDHTAEASKCISLRLDDDGDFIDPWPGGFFEEAYQEIFK